MTTPQQTAEALTGLKSRLIPRLNSADAAKGANDLGDHFRCQLGKNIARPETGLIPGKNGGEGRQEKWMAEYFVCSYFGATWEAVLAEVTRRKGTLA